MSDYKTTLDLELISATLNYYLPRGTYKKSVGMSRDAAFEKYDQSEIRSMVYALEKLGILEKHPSSDRKGSIYRLHSGNLEQWQTILSTLLADKPILPPLGLRDLAMLYVAGKFQKEHGRAPKTAELYTKDDKGRHIGLLNDFLHSSGMIDTLIFETTSTLALHKSATLLAKQGLMIERGSRERSARKPFEVTNEGLALVDRLDGVKWAEWLSTL